MKEFVKTSVIDIDCNAVHLLTSFIAIIVLFCTRRLLIIKRLQISSWRNSATVRFLALSFDRHLYDLLLQALNPDL